MEFMDEGEENGEEASLATRLTKKPRAPAKEKG